MTSSMISTVIPNRNMASQLPAALDAILAQQHQPCEILLLDDCSTDNSMGVMEDYRQRFPDLIRIERYPEKSAFFMQALLQRVSLLRGKFISVAAADDILHPETYKIAVPLMLRHPSAGVIFCNSIVAAPDGDMAFCGGLGESPTYVPPALMSQQLWRGWEQIGEGVCKPDLFENGAGSLIRRDALLWLLDLGAWRMGPYFDSMGYAAVAQRWGAVYLPQAFIRITTGASQYSRSTFDPVQCLPIFMEVVRFLGTPEILRYMPPLVVRALLRKAFVRLPTESRLALVTSMSLIADMMMQQ